MPKKKYDVKLTEEERTILEKLTTTGKSSANEIQRAKILLATDDNRVPKLTVKSVAEKCDSNTTTVQSVRKLYHEIGLDASIKRKKRATPPIAPKITGEVEAHVIALACSEPPEGYAKWAS